MIRDKYNTRFHLNPQVTTVGHLSRPIPNFFLTTVPQFKWVVGRVGNTCDGVLRKGDGDARAHIAAAGPCVGRGPILFWRAGLLSNRFLIKLVCYKTGFFLTTVLEIKCAWVRGGRTYMRWSPSQGRQSRSRAQRYSRAGCRLPGPAPPHTFPFQHRFLPEGFSKPVSS